ncbi:hypothetical protein AB0B50_01580 [Streptomyces sp. NPDC041068]
MMSTIEQPPPDGDHAKGTALLTAQSGVTVSPAAGDSKFIQ